MACGENFRGGLRADGRRAAASRGQGINPETIGFSGRRGGTKKGRFGRNSRARGIPFLVGALVTETDVHVRARARNRALEGEKTGINAALRGAAGR